MKISDVGWPAKISIDVPALEDEPAVRCHGDHELVVSMNEAWLRERLDEHFDADTNAITRALGLRTAWQACLMYPDAPTGRLQRLADMALPTLLAGRLFVTLGLCGDRLSAQLVRERLRHAIGTGRSEDYPLGSMIIDSLRAALELAPHRTATRYVRTWFAVLDHASNLALAGHRDVHDSDLGYLKMRRADIYGSWPALHVEYAIGVDLSAELASIKTLRDLRDAATDHAILVRDLYSWQHDYAQANVDNVLWTVLGPNRFAPPTAAFAVAGMIKDARQRFEASCAALNRGIMGAHPAFAAYVAGLRAMMAGNLHYHQHVRDE